MDNKIDYSNWREDYKKYTTNKMELELLENGPKSLSQSWHLQALFSNWKKVKGIKDPEPLNLQSSFKEWNDRVDNKISGTLCVVYVLTYIIISI